VGQWTYLAVLLFIVVGAGWLELIVRTRLAVRWRRWLLALLPGVVLFVAWDLYAIAQGHWDFDDGRVSGLTLPGGMPLEEALFFLVVPTAGLLTLEAVRSVKGWTAGDEEPR